MVEVAAAEVEAVALEAAEVVTAVASVAAVVVDSAVGAAAGRGGALGRRGGGCGGARLGGVQARELLQLRRPVRQHFRSAPGRAASLWRALAG